MICKILSCACLLAALRNVSLAVLLIQGVSGCSQEKPASSVVALPATGSQEWAIAFSPDGRWISSGGMNSKIAVTDVAMRKLQCSLASHGDSIRGIAFAPDSRIAASCDNGGTVLCWEASSGKVFATLKSSLKIASAVAFSADGRL